MKPAFSRFLIRWLVSSLGLWIAAGLFSQSISYQNRLTVIIVAGLILAVVNIILKPIIVILSLPAILITLGLFMVVVNGLMVYLVSKLYPALEITNFWAAIGTGVIIGLVNYLVSTILEAERQADTKPTNHLAGKNRFFANQPQDTDQPLPRKQVKNHKE